MFSTSIKFLTMVGLAASSLALPYQRREVPQEHSHQKFLTSVTALLQSGTAAENNPLGILDAVFGLLGDAAAAQGAGKVAASHIYSHFDVANMISTIQDVKCLQQATADQAFTNAKKAGDVAGMTAALAYRTLERNTVKVGLKSDLCTSIKAVNPEIAALTQHQDAASAGAKEGNKAIVLELARQIASVNGDPLVALQTGTFAPGDPNDPTAKGNSCDDQPDPVGCIETKNLLVPDATEAEIQAAVAGAGTAAGTQGGNASSEVANNSTSGAEVTASATAAGTASVAGTATGETVTATAIASNTTGCAVPVTVTVTAGSAQSTGAAGAKHAHHHKKVSGGNKAAAGAGNKSSNNANSAVSATQADATASATDVASTDIAASSATETAAASEAAQTDIPTGDSTTPATGKRSNSRFFGRAFA